MWKGQNDENLKNTPIVFLTAAVAKEDQGVISGHPFIAKPVDPDRLIDYIKENLWMTGAFIALLHASNLTAQDAFK